MWRYEMAKEEKDKKVVLVINGYMKIIVPLDAAYALFKLADTVEVIESKYDSAANKSYDIVHPAGIGYFKIEHLNLEQYALGKMTYTAEQTQQGETK
jgi:hypothetical protein